VADHADVAGAPRLPRDVLDHRGHIIHVYAVAEVEAAAASAGAAHADPGEGEPGVEEVAVAALVGARILAVVVDVGREFEDRGGWALSFGKVRPAAKGHAVRRGHLVRAARGDRGAFGRQQGSDGQGQGDRAGDAHPLNRTMSMPRA
jgi:hypothetical protein